MSIEATVLNESATVLAGNGRTGFVSRKATGKIRLNGDTLRIYTKPAKWVGVQSVTGEIINVKRIPQLAAAILAKDASKVEKLLKQELDYVAAQELVLE